MPANLDEGIVCKREDLPYRPGPSKSWLKIKNKAHPAMLRVKGLSNWNGSVDIQFIVIVGVCV